MQMNTSTTTSVLLGAALGAAAGYLCCTEPGKRTLRDIERWFGDLGDQLQHVKSAAANARSTMDQGREALSAIWNPSEASGHGRFEPEGIFS